MAKLAGVTLEVKNSNGTQLSASEFKLTRGDNIRIRISSDMVASDDEPRPKVVKDPATGNYALRVQRHDETGKVWSIPSLVGIDPWQPFTVEVRIRILRPGQGGLVSLGNRIALSYNTSGLNSLPPKWTFRTGYLSHGNLNSDERYVGQSVHLAGVFDGRIPRLYVDGVLVDDDLVKTLRGEPSVMIGPDAATPPRIKFAGQTIVGVTSTMPDYIIDEIRISQTARYTSNFKPDEHFEPDDQTLALYHLDEGTGDKLVDSSGNGHHGTIHQAIWLKQVAPNEFVPTDPDRAFAEWVLKRGGALTLNSGSLEPKSVDDLPPTPFRVFSAYPGEKEFTDQDLARLEGLRLTSLSLGLSPITGEGLAYIPTTIVLLTFHCVNVEGGNLMHLGRLQSLKSLFLTGTGDSIAADDLAVLTQLPNLESLRLPTSTTRAWLQHVVQCPALTKLSLRGTNLTATDIDVLADAPALTELNLYCGQLTPEWVDPLNRVKSLRTLAFDNDNNNVDAVALAKLTNVTTLRGSLGTLTDEDLEHLASMRQLKQLNIATNLKVTEAGVRKLHRQLPDCRIESEFGSFGPDYANERQVAEWVINRGGSVNVFVNRQRIEPAINAVDQLPGEPFVLGVVSLVNVSDLKDQELARLTNLSGLMTVVLTDTPITGEGLEHLANINSIGDLRLMGCKRLKDADLQPLTKLTGLQMLHLLSTPTGDAVIDFLPSWPKLTNLYLGENTTNEGLKRLKHPTIQMLSLVGCKNLPDEITLDMEQLPSLTQLALQSRHATKDFCEGLVQFKKLRTLGFDGGARDFDASVLTPLTQLTTLNLSTFGLSITNEDLTHLAALEKLEELHVKNT